MNLKLDLHRVRRFPQGALAGGADLRALWTWLCEALDETHAAEFVVTGFGEEPWPLDVAMDLPPLLEQLPAALRAVHAGRPLTLDFAEQGMERTLHFKPTGNLYEVRCESRTSWRPSADLELVSMQDLERQLREARDALVEFLEKRVPDAASDPQVMGWAAGHA